MKLSDLARPPVQPHEIESADTAICVTHDGLIASSFSPADEGKVFYCPVGRMFWRFSSKGTPGMYGPLNYQHERPI